MDSILILIHKREHVWNVSVGLLATLADARVLVELLRETVRSIALISQVFIILVIILLLCV